MKSASCLLALVVLVNSVQGAAQWTLGASPGLGVPAGGNIRHFQPGFAPGLDLRLNGLTPVVGLGLSASRVGIKGPYHDSLRRDSSNYTYSFLQASLSLFTDFSPLLSEPLLHPYLRFGAGPAYWEERRQGNLIPTADSGMSKQLDCHFELTFGIEKPFASLPVMPFLEANYAYVASSDFKRYGYQDEDEALVLLRAGLRMRIR